MIENCTYCGVVVKTTGSWYIVRTAEGELVNCRIRGKFRIKGIKTTNPIAVGDKVEFEKQESDEAGVIIRLFDRQNCIIRRSTNLSKQTHILAANVDQACLVVTLAFPRTSTGFMDRFLVSVAAYDVPAIICFNKIDLLDEIEELKEYHNEIISIYRNAGYTCLEVSALKKTNIDLLKAQLKDKTTLFAGHSGAGKSALINAIDPLLELKTGDVSVWSQKGKHTTTFAEMLPITEGGYIIDSPGIKEFGMVNFSKEELSHYYPEMKAVLSDCRFHNCTHEHEPGCAVKEAVEAGEISETRYFNYLNILNGREMDLEEWETR